jgi:hypothetical protein
VKNSGSAGGLAAGDLPQEFAGNPDLRYFRAAHPALARSPRRFRALRYNRIQALIPIPERHS